MKNLFGAPMIIGLTVLASAGVVFGAYRYRQQDQATVYESVHGSSSPITLIPQNIPTGDWAKLIAETNQSTSTDATATPTNSDLVSKEILARFVLAKQLGQDVTTDQANEIAGDILQYANSLDGSSSLEQYTSNDVILSTDTTAAAAAYAKSLRVILTDNNPDIGNELVIMQQAVVDNNLANIGKLKTISATYEQIAKELIKIPVPPPIAGQHLILANLYLRLSKDVGAFAVVKNDPVIAGMNFNDYGGVAETFGQTTDNIGKYLLSKGVNF